MIKMYITLLIVHKSQALIPKQIPDTQSSKTSSTAKNLHSNTQQVKKMKKVTYANKREIWAGKGKKLKAKIQQQEP